jgi:GGDEF domain-containing protein
MNYFGRIFVSTLTIVAYILVTIGHGVPITSKDLMLILIFSVFAWFSGKQYDLVKFYSEKDFLTKAYNRRYAEGIFPELKNKVDKSNQSLFIFILDVNDFKDINDTFKHVTGDKALFTLSHILLKTINNQIYYLDGAGMNF